MKEWVCVGVRVLSLSISITIIMIMKASPGAVLGRVTVFSRSELRILSISIGDGDGDEKPFSGGPRFYTTHHDTLTHP